MEGFEDSQALGFNQLWPIAPDYQIVEGQVCPLVDGQFIQQGRAHFTKGCRMYLPMPHGAELATELSRVFTESDARNFVARNGLLGYSQAWSITEMIGARVREAELFGARVLEGGHEGEPLHGDPLPWVLVHAQTVRLILDLLGLLGPLNDEAALRVFLDTLKVVEAGHPDTYLVRFGERGSLYAKFCQLVWRGEGPRDVALRILEEILRPNLTGITLHPTAQTQDNGRQGLSPILNHHNLLDCVYWHLAAAAMGGDWVRRCKNPRCERWFIAKSLKVKYCPPLRNYANDDEQEPVSLCMTRHKQQSLRDRKAEEEARQRRTRERNAKRKRKRQGRTTRKGQTR